ncbi:MAG: hypothetical protein DRR04_02530 [Gammaproteobacteria bacterium]|nr:MAG: hypothetical protein DRR04_02530 [Gammaproteobacteria bacterium]
MRNVVILGMHRSGTSMVAAALASAGLYAGRPAELLVAQEDNPHGFWERRDVVALNDEILSSYGANWYQPPAEPTRASADHLAAIQSILEQMPADRSWLLKDPRLVVTWPLWEQALDDAVVVFVYRDPLAVAASLRRRNGFALSLGLALWEYYNHFTITALQGRDVICLSFDTIAADPAVCLDGVLEQLVELGVACERSLDAGVFDASLGKSRAADQDMAEALLTPSQRELAHYCRALCEGGQLLPLPTMDDGLWPRLQDMASALATLAQVRATQLELAEATRLCAERTAERDEVLDGLHRLEDEHTALAHVHRDEVARHERLQQKTEALFVELSQMYGKLLNFEESVLARIWRFTARCYKFLTRRRGFHSSYDDVLAGAREHFDKHGLFPPLDQARKPPGKVSLLRDILSYVARNPAGSMRSFSLARLKRAAGVFINASPEDLGVWIDSRFPEQADAGFMSSTYPLDESLDELQLVFPVVDSPQVSIVVPVFNEYRVTMRCLKSVLDNSAGLSYEIIIADDCSSDLTASIVERVSNITVVRGEANRGFLLNCNAAAGAARGDYILLLNNDTAVCPNWLSALYDTIAGDSSVGIVGPKLLFEDGRLQEAGAIMWRDASAWNFGRMDNPQKSAYNYRKEVDYISGACLLLRADLWRQLGGFDQRYCPAYYEDADIAFQARAAGYKVVYQPLSTVFHFEGVSCGTDLGSGIKKYQVQNQVKFRDKWQRELDDFHFANGSHVFQARDRSRHQRCVLFIDHYVPHYDKDAGSRSTFMYVKLMLEMGYRVLFLGANYFPHQPYTKALQQLGVEVLVGEYMARNQDRWLRENAPYIDCIYLHRPHVAEQFLASLHKMKPRPKLIFFGHDLHYLRISREFAVIGDQQLRKDAEKWRKREYAVFDRVDKIYYPSQVEVDEISAHRPDLDVRAIPLYALDDSAAPAYDFGATSDILFVGGFNHPPNVDAICWFAEEVMPLVQQGCPGIRLHVVGSNPTDDVQDLQSEHVVVYGYLSDEELEALYRRVRQVVVPLRFGAGVKGKVLEAIQKNLPVVTTSIGAEGLPEADRVMTIADSAEQLAACVISVNGGDTQALDRLEAYPRWLQQYFSKANAATIILEDFGGPNRELPA